MFKIIMIILVWVIGILVTAIWESVTNIDKNIDKLLYDNLDKDVEDSNTR